MIVAFAYGFELLLLLICCWFVLQRTMGREQANLLFIFPFAEWQIFAVIGMTIYGLHPFSDEKTDPNNLHIIFLPVMTGYGLAFLSVLWNRLSLPLHVPVVRNGHFIIAIIISALPTLLTAPTHIAQSVTGHELQKIHYPYYYPKLLVEYCNMVKPNEAIVTDIPWAVSWYGNRAAIWLPKDKGQLETMRENGKLHSQPITGLLLSQYTLSASPSSLLDSRNINFAWREYILFGPMMIFPKTEAAQRDFMTLILSDHAIKQPASGLFSPYLFMTENPVVKKENESSGALDR